MDDFDVMKKVWNSNSNSDVSTPTQIHSAIKKFKQKKKRNAFWVTASFILCALAFIVVLILLRPMEWTTIIGVISILIAFILGIFQKLKSLKSITKTELKSNKEFLEQMVDSAQFTKTNWLQIFTILLFAVGYALFIYEGIKDSFIEMCLSYLGIILFSVFMYFVFRPYMRTVSQHKVKKMTEIIQDLK
ncbi:hypothetical protein [Brumimicrobium aurantiacum]|uniref:Uncharacterized protein n=1 Tax=Brumimicrobium aurantiacum TaxID=1737063 RepID=A0A3E1EXJ8_9FLAO|nr:hypothetical protein [Brumimicrobium aurantiacum]RFC54274.1 hypothetical protein DXU93_09825 [Brumimicrobium aurantiacum]